MNMPLLSGNGLGTAGAVVAGNEVVEKIVGYISDGKVEVEAVADVVGDADADAHNDDQESGENEIELHKVLTARPFAADTEEEYDLKENVKWGSEEVNKHKDVIGSAELVDVALG